MKFKRYDNYQDSEIDWLGEIPQHWEINKLKSSVKKIADIDHYMPPTVSVGKPYIMTGDLCEQASLIDFTSCKQVTEEEYIKLSKKIKPTNGDLIFARYATIGTVCYVDIEKEFLVSYSCVTIRPNNRKIIGKYLFYFFKSNFFLQDIRSYINSNTQGNVGTDSLYRTNLILLPLNEQNEIVNYIDTKTQKIDKEISILEQKIEKYKELKQTLIAETVLRGLDKNIELEDSETEWIGNIPIHWNLHRMKDYYYISKKTVGENSNKFKLLSLTQNGVIYRDIDSGMGKFPAEFNTYQVVDENDLIFCLFDMDVTPRTIGLSSFYGMITGAYTVIKTKKEAHNKYFYYLFLMADMKKKLSLYYSGLRSTIRKEKFMALNIPIPPHEEQVEIANYLDEKTIKIDSIVETIGKKIEVLKEFRKTLINDVVTGKVKVA